MLSKQSHTNGMGTASIDKSTRDGCQEYYGKVRDQSERATDLFYQSEESIRGAASMQESSRKVSSDRSFLLGDQQIADRT